MFVGATHFERRKRQDNIFQAIQTGSEKSVRTAVRGLNSKELLDVFLKYPYACDIDILNASVRASYPYCGRVVQVIVEAVLRAEKEYLRHTKEWFPGVTFTQKHPLINGVNVLGQTALHVAAEYNKPAAARLLLAVGANALIKDNTGKTPYEIVIRSWQKAMNNATSVEEKMRINQDMDAIISVLREADEIQSGKRKPVQKHGLIERVMNYLNGGRVRSNAA